ncbi:MAG: pentapeptide repeat-containing protein [Acidobacteriota bacterium]
MSGSDERDSELEESLRSQIESYFEDSDGAPQRALGTLNADLAEVQQQVAALDDALARVQPAAERLDWLLSGDPSEPPSAPPRGKARWQPTVVAWTSILTVALLTWQVSFLRKEISIQTEAYRLQSENAYLTQRAKMLEIIYGECGPTDAAGAPAGEAISHGAGDLETPCQVTAPTEARRAAVITFLHLERKSDDEDRLTMSEGLARLVHAPLEGIPLDEVDLSRVNLTGADLYNADLSLSPIDGSNFFGADLRFAKFPKGPVANVNLGSANLADAILKGVTFVGTDMTDTVLRRADLSGADLRDVRGLKPDQVCSAKAYPNPPPQLPADLVLPAECTVG